MKSRRDAVFGAGSTLFYDQPVHIVRGEGVYLHAADGTRYVDMYNNVPSVGHCHPHVVEAVSKQLATLNVHNRYLHEAILEYGERLLATHHDGIENVVFSCTGTEANEVALMMARTATGGQGIICTDAAYHGNSTEVRRLNRCSSRTGDIRSVPFPDLFRFDGETTGGDPLTWYLSRIEQTIDSFHNDGIPFAGLLFCPIFANEGLPSIPDGYLPEVARIVREAGGLFICDEVQAGLCRTGRWWGYEIQGAEPDIVSMGKPLGAGMPLAATAARRDLVENFRSRMRYFNTFASTPAQAAAGNAVLDVIESEQLLENISRVGDWLRAALTQLMSRHEGMADVRGDGLFVSIEWVQDRQSREPDVGAALKVVDGLKTRGFLTSNAGAYNNIVKLRPPLVFAQDDAEAFIDAYADVLANLR